MRNILIFLAIAVAIWWFFLRGRMNGGANNGSPEDDANGGILSTPPQYTNVEELPTCVDPQIGLTIMDPVQGIFDFNFEACTRKWTGEHNNNPDSFNSAYGFNITVQRFTDYVFAIRDVRRADGSVHTYLYIFDVKWGGWLPFESGLKPINSTTAIKATAINWRTGQITIVK
jgi:hypothetical protein